MKIKILKSKIHRATVTEARLDYEGSVSIDEELINASGLSVHEKVHILDITNGSRIETYVIKAPFGSKSICINGAAAHLIKPNDQIIILSYCLIDKEDSDNHSPYIIKVNKKNEIIVE